MEQGANTKENTKKFRQELADIFVRSLNEKQLDWQKGWNTAAAAGMPVNAATGRQYKGINAVYLYLNALEACNWNEGEADNRWATFHQIQEKGWRLKENSKGTGRKVEFWQPYDYKDKKNLTWEEYRDRKDEKGVTLLARYYTVFNGSQIIGIPELKKDRTNDGRVVVDDPLINKISSGMGVPITNDGGDSAYYKPDDDTIHLPVKEAFQDSYEYNATALHEFSHASGASHRLNRLPHNGSMESRAYEELVAEMSSCFMAQHLDVQQTEKHIENHKAYVQSWIQEIQKQPEILGRAIHDAIKAADYLEFHGGILSREEYLNRKGQEEEIQNQVTGQETENVKDADSRQEQHTIDSRGVEEYWHEPEQIEEIPMPGTVDLVDASKGIKVQFEITLVNGEVIHIDNESEGKNLAQQMWDALDNLSAQFEKEYSVIAEKEYTILVNKNVFDNRCTINFKKEAREDQYDTKKMIMLQGENFNVNFHTLEEPEIRKIVSDYLKGQMLIYDRIGKDVSFDVLIRKKGTRYGIDGMEKIEGTLRGVQGNTYLVETEEGERQVKADEIYDDRQARVMKAALKNNVEGEYLEILGNPKLSADQMEQALHGIKEGLIAIQIVSYAQPKIRIWEMELYRYGMKNGLSPFSVEKVIADSEVNANQKEASRRKVDNLINEQRNQIIQDLKNNGLLPEKHLVLDIQRLCGMEGRTRTVEYIFKRLKEGSIFAEEPVVSELRKQICGKINHQRRQLQHANFQGASQAMVR